MESLDLILAALAGGADNVLNALAVVAGSYASFIVVRLGGVLLKGVPAWVRAFVASGLESNLQPIVENAVRHAEEWAQRQVDEGLAKAQSLGPAKLAKAKQYILDATPNLIISDERLSALIDAGLVRVGRGAAGAVTLGVEWAQEQIDRIPKPPAA